MRRQIIFGKCALIFLLGVALSGCDDPQKEAARLFASQGLTVLEPARDYIALGGLFVVPKSGKASYLDPYDTLPGANGSATPFRAVVMQQSLNQSAGFGAAVGTLGGLVPIPAGLKFSDSKQVELAQIDANGTRYTSQMVAALIKKPSTGEAIQTQLLADPKNRIFIVQEIYTAKTLSLKSSNGTGLAAAVEGSATIPNCAPQGSDGANTSGGNSSTGKNATGQAGSGNSGTASSGAGGAPSTSSAGNATGGKAPSKTGTGSSGGSGAGATNSSTTAPGAKNANGKSQTGNTATNSASGAGGADVGISVGVCWASSTTLSFKTDPAIPFAVRLNEVVKAVDNNLAVKITNFKLPNSTLGGDDVSASALVMPDQPILYQVARKRH